MYFVGIDIGSSATKAAAVDGTGAILATAVIPMALAPQAPPPPSTNFMPRQTSLRRTAEI